MSLIRVLVVEDSAPFRQYICQTLAKSSVLQVICEVSDGQEAVHRALELKPDLILLDIGLPTLNGIEAARQIHKLSPQSKILFMSQESDPDIVRSALGLGAWGYVVKTRAGSDLLSAVQAVCDGRPFVSAVLSTRAIPRPAPTVNFACVICNRPVSLEASRTNELGQAVHGECYAAKTAIKTAALKDAAL